GTVVGGAVVGGAVVGGSVLGGSNSITMLSIAPDPLSTTANADPDNPTGNVATFPSPRSGIGTLAPSTTISPGDSSTSTSSTSSDTTVTRPEPQLEKSKSIRSPTSASSGSAASPSSLMTRMLPSCGW